MSFSSAEKTLSNQWATHKTLRGDQKLGHNIGTEANDEMRPRRGRSVPRRRTCDIALASKPSIQKKMGKLLQKNPRL